MDHDFILSDATVQKYELKSNVVTFKHFWFLHTWQQEKHFKYAPRITDKSFPTTSFAKMKVGRALDIFNNDTAAALTMLHEKHDYDGEEGTPPGSVQSTAWAVKQISKWFAFMSSRSRNHCFSMAKEHEFVNVMNFLDDFNEWFDLMTFDMSSGREHKPIQKAVWVITMSMKDRVSYYLNERQWSFLLGGRFGSDCIENFFSQVRRPNPAPTCMEFQRRFRALLILQHMKGSKYGSYQEDDQSKNWITMLSDIRALALERANEDFDEDDFNVFDFFVGDREVKDYAEEQALAYVIGYLLLKTVFTQSKCKVCQEAFALKFNDGSAWLKLIEEKSFVPNALTCPTEMAYKIFSLCESNFIEYNKNVLTVDNFVEKLCSRIYDTILEKVYPNAPTCHLKLVMRRFFTIRMHFFSRQLTVEAKGTKEFTALYNSAGYSSKSVKGYQLG